jgi:Lrp/AsnC family leucine-responsive transcriptional regulator
MSFDSTDWRLLDLLQSDARQTFAELGRKVKLSPPAVAERIRRQEDRGVITGYRAQLDPAKLGLTLEVFLRVQVPPKEYAKFQTHVARQPRVLECHHLTGAESFLVRAVLPDVKALEDLIGRLSAFGQTTTSIVLSSPMKPRALSPAAAE